jgi:hypothetical protein
MEVTARNRRLFEVFAKEVEDSCGDGDGAFILKGSPAELAELISQFEDWFFKECPHIDMTRTDYEWGTVFCHDPETHYVFATDYHRQLVLDAMPWADIWMEVYYDAVAGGS